MAHNIAVIPVQTRLLELLFRFPFWNFHRLKTMVICLVILFTMYHVQNNGDLPCYFIYYVPCTNYVLIEMIYASSKHQYLWDCACYIDECNFF